MRWLPFFILAYVVLGLQLGVSEFLKFGGASPSLVLIMVVFVAGNAPHDSALLGSFLLGLFEDLITVQPMGLHAFAYGVAGLLVAGSRQVAYSDHPLTSFFLTVGTGLLTAIIFWIHHLIRPPAAALEVGGVTLPAISTSGGSFFLSAFYTAILAIPMLWLLAKFKPIFGFRVARQRY